MFLVSLLFMIKPIFRPATNRLAVESISRASSGPPLPLRLHLGLCVPDAYRHRHNTLPHTSLEVAIMLLLVILHLKGVDASLRPVPLSHGARFTTFR
jgi:hypothetical protein